LVVVAAGLADRKPSPLGRDDPVVDPRTPRWRRLGGERRVKAVERLLVAALALERTGKAGEVARWRVPPSLAVGIAAIDVHQQSRQRAHVLIVVAHDVDQRPGLAPAEVIEISAGNLPARDVRAASKAEQLRFDRRQPRIRHPVAEDTPDQRQEIEVASVQRWIRTRHPIPGHEERPVEAAAVVRDEPATGLNPRRQLGEERRLVGVIGQQELDLPEAAALPPAEPDKEGERARGRREPGRLGIEAE
jgi:hypothetical protein